MGTRGIHTPIPRHFCKVLRHCSMRRDNQAVVRVVVVLTGTDISPTHITHMHVSGGFPEIRFRTCKVIPLVYGCLYHVKLLFEEYVYMIPFARTEMGNKAT